MAVVKELVSVIIPVYNVEQYINATLRSVLDQTYSRLEVLVVDDGSPDRSVHVCRQFTDSRIKIIQQQNRGLAGARNTGIRQAQGEFLAFLDGDDLWRPNKLACHLEHLKRSPQVGVSFSRSEFMDEQGNPLGTYLMPKLRNIDLEALFQGNPAGNGSASVFRRQTLDAIRYTDTLHGMPEEFYFDERFRRSEDIECLLRIAIQTSWQIEGIPEALTLYRVNPGGLSASLLKQLESWEQVMQKIATYAPDVAAQWYAPSMAYEYRYLARNAVRLRDKTTALTFANRALTTHWPIVLTEPRRTLRTLLLAYALWMLPASLYEQLEAIAANRTGSKQRQRILQEQDNGAMAPAPEPATLAKAGSGRDR